VTSILRYGGLFLGLLCEAQGAVVALGGPDLIRVSGAKWRGFGPLGESLLGPTALQFLSAFFWLALGAGLIYFALRYAKRAP
jgi:hypothetical protein